jgi:hypothetical protein
MFLSYDCDTIMYCTVYDILCMYPLNIWLANLYHPYEMPFLPTHTQIIHHDQSWINAYKSNWSLTLVGNDLDMDNDNVLSREPSGHQVTTDIEERISTEMSVFTYGAHYRIR